MYDGRMQKSIGLAVGVVVLVLVYAFACAPDGQRADWVMVALTAALIYVGGTQAYIYWKQKGVMEDALTATRDSNDVARESAQAATKSAEAATIAANATQSLERPWLVVEPGRLPIQVMPPSSSSAAILEVPYTISNFGRSPAWIVEDLVSAVWVQDPFDVPDDLPTPDLAVSKGPRGIPLASGERRPTDRRPAISLFPPHQRRMLDGKGAILLYGEIKYRDVFGDIWTHGFAWVYTRIDDSLPIQDRQWPTTWDEDAEHRLWTVFQGPEAYLKKST